jgi:hypothetical protein
MEKQLSDKLKIIDSGDNVVIVYVHDDGATKNILFNNDGIYFNSTNSVPTAIMPLAYSSQFQTATLSNYLQAKGLLAFADIVNYSFTSTVNGASTTMAIKTA